MAFETIATNAIHAASAAIASTPTLVTSSAIGDQVASGLWSFVGSALGGAVAIGLALWQQAAQGKRERIKMATDSGGSHMANVAFDKYVQFCEAYLEVLEHANEMTFTRLKWSPWTTSETDAKLEPFEVVFRQLGATAGYVEATINDPKATNRGEEIDKMYALFADVMGFKEWNGQKMTGKLAQTALIERMREALGTEHFAKLRRTVLDRALSNLVYK